MSENRTTLVPAPVTSYIDAATYKSIERMAAANTVVNSSTTPTQAAYLLGVEHVLRVIRTNFLSGR